ncbi:MAG: hypothetical protein LHV68_06220 [Elusimicrobia bacterium]|nr:hypothetical protein [Candidatus Liberimonas magnetica]
MGRTSRSLEDQFFFQKDLELKEKQRALQQMKETKDALREASGIQDEAVLQKLVDLNIKPDTVASLAVVPLVEVAWANGTIGLKEKEAVLTAVSKFGWTNKNIDYMLLERWLEHKPDPALLQAWGEYTKYVCEQMNSDEVVRFRTEIMSHAKAISEVSGGILGLGKISQQEKEMLEIIYKSFITNCEEKHD